MTFVGNRRCYDKYGNRKKNYTAEKFAQQAAGRRNKENSARVYVAYACDDCGGWHVGGFDRQALESLDERRK